MVFVVRWSIIVGGGGGFARSSIGRSSRRLQRPLSAAQLQVVLLLEQAEAVGHGADAGVAQGFGDFGEVDLYIRLG